MTEIEVRRLGCVEYPDSLTLQATLVEQGFLAVRAARQVVAHGMPRGVPAGGDIHYFEFKLHAIHTLPPALPALRRGWCPARR